jgi:hypothetical protein
MNHAKTLVIALCGVIVGAAGTILFAAPLIPRHHREVAASASSDRYQDYVMATGAVAINPRAPTDGVWLLDYRSGKLLATVIDRTLGKITGWAEMDLVAEFNIPPKGDFHFMMTTGTIAQGQAALYVAEVSTGKFGVYTMGPAAEGTGIMIRSHDQTTFRAKAKP